jgi:hypothetical protein
MNRLPLPLPLPEPDVVITDAGEAWGYPANKEVIGTYYYTAEQMKAYVEDSLLVVKLQINELLKT